MPSALGTSDSESIESLAVAPAVLNPGLPTQPYASNATILPSAYGGTAPTYTVGSGNAGACNAPQTISPAALPPQVVNGTALEYANTAPSTDTILRPTPLGAQEITQIRDATAPETANYQIALGPGQYLQQLTSGSIAVIDPSIPSISSTLAPDVTIPPGTTSAAPDSGGTPSGAGDPSVEPPTADEPGVRPDDDSAILPTQTRFQYENEDQLLHLADQEADGQEVAIVTPPWAKDATGTALPVDMAITGTNTYAITTHHRQAGTNYPAMASRKMGTTRPVRHQFVLKQLDSGAGAGFVASTSDGKDGVSRIVKVQHEQAARVVIGPQDVCEKYDQKPNVDLAVDFGKNSDGPGLNSTKDGPAPGGNFGDCYKAASLVQTALNTFPTNTSGLYVTVTPAPNITQTKLTEKAYAAQISRLWQDPPFNMVKKWGATNEPELHNLTPQYAAKAWKELKRLAPTKSKIDGKALCPKCKIIAGEFVRFKPNKDSDEKKYIRDYMSALPQRGQRVHSGPMFWAFHDYYDIVKTDPRDAKNRNRPSTVYPFAYWYANRVRTLFGTDRNVLASEQGVLLSNEKGVFPAVSGKPREQVFAAQRLERLGSADRQIRLNGFYEFFGTTNKFDSGLVKPPDPPQPNGADAMGLKFPPLPPPPGPGDDTFRYRPAYCILADRPMTNCVSDGT